MSGKQTANGNGGGSRATISVRGRGILTYQSGDRAAFLRAANTAFPWVALTLDADEAQRLGCELTGLDNATLHLTAAEADRFPRLGQTVEVNLFRIPDDPFAAFEDAAEECR